jgi:hypothetical protein
MLVRRHRSDCRNANDGARGRPFDDVLRGVHRAPPGTSGENSQFRRHGFFGAVGPRAPKTVKFPQNGWRLNTPWWFSLVWGELTGRSGQVPPRTLELAGNPPHANHLNMPASRSVVCIAAAPALLPAGRQP